MLKHSFHIKSIEVSHSESLFPKGLSWKLSPGLNIILGGTGLGKTTLVNAMLFGLLGELGKSSKHGVAKITPEYFAGRVKSKSGIPAIKVVADIEGKNIAVSRFLHSGRIESFEIDGQKEKTSSFETKFTELIGADFENEVMRIVDHLLYVSESRYLFSWDSQLQNEVLTLLFSSSEEFTEIQGVWEHAQSEDSKYRNLRHQANRIAEELKKISEKKRGSDDGVPQKRLQFATASENLISERNCLKEKIKEENGCLLEKTERLNAIEKNYLTLTEKAAVVDAPGVDSILQETVFSSPSAHSIYTALHAMAANPKKNPCPSCGNTKVKEDELKRLSSIIESGGCPCCGNKPGVRVGYKPSNNDNSKQNDQGVLALSQRMQALINEVEQSRSRLMVFRRELQRSEEALSDARDAEWRFNLNHPVNTGDPVDSRQISLNQFRGDEKRAKERRDEYIKRFEILRNKLNKTFSSRDKEIAAKFKHYAQLYLDESCEIVFDPKGEYAVRPGPQLNPLHSSFYPKIDGTVRTKPNSLSEAQRLFVDLAFRMAVVDVWSSYSKKKVFFIIETPEGSVDAAYMARVAEMLRNFANKGHTVLITTNLNNENFLPELLKMVPKAERHDRVLNLLDIGIPHKVQIAYKSEFDAILERAFS